nr:MAG TPA: tetratricopeptide repeat protein [Bacteriophage sp.]
MPAPRRNAGRFFVLFFCENSCIMCRTVAPLLSKVI